MQSVSQAWVANQNSLLVSKAYIDITLNVGDPEAQYAAWSYSNGEEFYSESDSIVQEIEKNPIKYATLERNIWTLDGSLSTIPDKKNYGRNGYIGEWLCGNDGVFENIPIITVEFGRVFSHIIPGITIVWGEAYGEYADTFRVTAFNGQEVVAEKLVEENTVIESIVWIDIQNYDRITVEVLKWCLPYRRPRIKSLNIGLSQTFDGNNVMSYSHRMDVDPLSASLPMNEISFKAANLNNEYNPDNPTGLMKYMMERQMLTVKYGYKLGNAIEWIDAGTFYLNDWTLPQNGITADFGARDVLEFMTDIYTGDYVGTLYDVALQALKQASLPLLKTGETGYYVDDSLRTIPVPEVKENVEYTIAEVLQLCANAACCVIYQDRNGQLRIEPLSGGVSDYRIDQFNSYSVGDVVLSKQLKAVDVNNGMYVLQVGPVGETQPISNPLISVERAPAVAQWVADYLSKRQTLTGNFRADPRLDPLTRVTNQNQFAEKVVLVTEVQYTYNGAFRGSYEGRVDV